MQSNRDVQFKRLCGVKRHTFATRRDLFQAAAAAAAKRKAGRPWALSWEAQLLMTLLSWRQYGTL